MQKIYRYRRLSEFLFKELYYQELYYSSSYDLNDPADLSTILDFSPRYCNEIRSLLYTMYMAELDISYEKDFSNLYRFYREPENKNEIRELIFNNIKNFKSQWRRTYITEVDLIKILKEIGNKITVKIDYEHLEYILKEKKEKILQCCQSISFSLQHDISHMWAHYADGHRGICLEFTVDDNLFKTIRNGVYDDKELIRVKYENELRFVNFFRHKRILCAHRANYHNIDKENIYDLKKDIENCCQTKFLDWKKEKEVRLINFNFNHVVYPEDRLVHYPIENLSSVYFGLRTPPELISRIKNMLININKSINFYKAESSINDCVYFGKTN